MSDEEFDEQFEGAPDWPTAVTNLRRIVSSDGQPAEPRLALLKDSARDTILAVLADHELEFGYASMSRYTGGKAEISAPPFHTFVLRKAFFCYRQELIPADVVEAARVAREEFKRADERRWDAVKKLPPEMRGRQ